MAANRRNSNSNTQLLQELEELSETMYQSHVSTKARRTNSLVLPRTSIPAIPSADEVTNEKDEISLNPKPRSRRLSLSPWRSRTKLETEETEQVKSGKSSVPTQSKGKWTDESSSATPEKKGLWNWKPIRALTHITMQKLSCLMSVEVVTVQNLQPSMNGLRLSVCVRKKESKEGAVQTMPSRVSQGAADFEETLFIRCHVYYMPGSGGQMKFEPRPFYIYVLAVDAEELDFGRNTVDLSGLIQESIEKNFEGTRIRQWDTTFNLLGKAKGGELVLKLGFQIMEKDGGVGIYSQLEGKSGKSKNSPSFARKQSKTSFSVASPRLSTRTETWTPSQKGPPTDLQGIDDLNLDEPAPQPSNPAPVQKIDEPEAKVDDNDLPDFEVEDKGVEILDKDVEEEKEEERSEDFSDAKSVSSEVVKEVVQDQTHVARFTELDAIAQQIKALESIMGDEKAVVDEDEETGSQTLDADEDKVTREFLQMLEDGDDDKLEMNNYGLQSYKTGSEKSTEDGDTDVYLPDLGKGLGSVVQTRNGGYLAATNPLDTIVDRKDTPKLAMQISKPLILQSNKTGFELFQKMAAIGLEELTSEISSLMPLDELKGKAAEQIAFEGMASAIIQGRNKEEGASSSAARTIATVKSMANAMNTGRKERISTGIWNVSEEPLTIEEILAFSIQKIENMAIDALKIQAGVTEEDAPFDVSPLDAKTVSASGKTYNNLLESAIAIDELKVKGTEDEAYGTITISVLVQLRDPLRQFEAVGGPMIVLIHASGVDSYVKEKYKVGSLQVGSIRSSVKKSTWDTEKHKLTALQWLVAYGIVKAAKKGKRVELKGPDLIWSISSRIMADMWLKPIRNPDVKFTK